jgi:flagellar hook-length control protein FliK
MNTQAIPSANILATPAPVSAGSPSSANANEASFNQVLQREISEKRGADSASKGESKPSADASAQAASGKTTSEASKTESSGTDKPGEAGTSDEPEQLSDAAYASAELLALVANMAHIAAPAADAEANDAELAMQIDPDAASGKGKKTVLDMDTLADGRQPGKNGQDADGKLAVPSGFANTVTQLPRDASASERVPQAATLQTASPVASSAPAALADAPSITPTAAPNAALMAVQLNKAQAATTHASDILTPPVGTQAWDQAVGQKVVWMVAGAQQSASLTLNPPDLGPMQIVLNVTNSQANATFVAAQPEVRQALEAALPKLREMLGDAGIQLGQASVSAGTPQHGNGSEQHGRTSSRQTTQNDAIDPTIPAQRSTVIRQGLGMVDTFA